MSSLQPSSGRPVEILIAEDSPTQAQRLRHVLEKQGYGVHHAANGRLAFEAAVYLRPTMIISDVVMPEMDGYELCRRVKSEQTLGNTPVILVTTLSDPLDVIRGLECRADNFVLKPYEESHLLSHIQFVLANHPVQHAEQVETEVEIFFNGRKHLITSGRLQVLNLLLSTYQAAMQRNRELGQTQDTLRRANFELQQLTQELEDRVFQRTVELERKNEELRQAYDDLRKTQEAALQQERLSALGQMASGIAHDINNAISPVAMYTESLLESEPNLSTRARSYLETTQRAIQDVAATVGRMREFYRQRGTEVVFAPVNMNDLARQVVDLTRARWSDMPQQRGVVVKMRTELASDLPAVLGVESEIRETLTNLIFNAVDAMPEGGMLTLRTIVAAPVVSGTGERLHLEVTDTGLGMDEETRHRCLEPFFTTKGERGTGLGLAMVYGMMRRHSAELEIESELGLGTTMRLSFAIPASISADAAKSPAPAVVVSEKLRILVVDDDPVLLTSLRDILESDGHAVIAANSGRAGMETFSAAQSHEPFALVITDLGMPDIDGRKVAAAVKNTSPGTPVILFTGWGQRMMADGDIPPHVDRILSKPPKLRELREALIFCLESAKPVEQR
ncbi:MAG TPA: response regulator [Bryobacteraceae bacterium]|jgi:signal transduction histidine kinase|nr:response regulator [Bryobacteraceae bacterium]